MVHVSRMQEIVMTLLLPKSWLVDPITPTLCLCQAVFPQVLQTCCQGRQTGLVRRISGTCPSNDKTNPCHRLKGVCPNTQPGSKPCSYHILPTAGCVENLSGALCLLVSKDPVNSVNSYDLFETKRNTVGLWWLIHNHTCHFDFWHALWVLSWA